VLGKNIPSPPEVVPQSKWQCHGYQPDNGVTVKKLIVNNDNQGNSTKVGDEWHVVSSIDLQPSAERKVGAISVSTVRGDMSSTSRANEEWHNEIDGDSKVSGIGSSTIPPREVDAGAGTTSSSRVALSLSGFGIVPYVGNTVKQIPSCLIMGMNQRDGLPYVRLQSNRISQQLHENNHIQCNIFVHPSLNNVDNHISSYYYDDCVTGVSMMHDVEKRELIQKRKEI
jgi:hypothetical protein